MAKNGLAILWVRNDFRLNDNLALFEASQYETLIPVYIWDEHNANTWKPGGASQWWLHYSVMEYQKQLVKLGSKLIIMKGDPSAILAHLATQCKANDVLWNRSHDPSELDLVKKVKNRLEKNGVNILTFQGNVLSPISDLCKEDGTPYLVYTAFWKNFLKKYQVKTIHKPKKLPEIPLQLINSIDHVNTLDLLPKIKWYKEFGEYWEIGEVAALKKTNAFLKSRIKQYGSVRDQPQLEGTSRLSPHLHFGEIHPQRVLAMICKEFGPLHHINDLSIVQYCKEIVWREFNYHLIQHFPKTMKSPLRDQFKKFPWKNNKRYFNAWCQGQTGYPIVDAGMRQLWRTGWMHNRVRMVVASFLVKHLNIPWIEGAKWFWDTLVDADIASNSGGWQWVAGCGADAAPFFRIFNPITQGEKFDPEGKYAAKWCPELSLLPAKWIYKPWEAPAHVLKKAHVKIGENYPCPIVDHKEARAQALSNYETVKGQA